jgi:hypothetical protein
MPDPLRDRFYEFGVLMQQCGRCGWTMRGHDVELDACPDCRERLHPPLAIEFGGLRAMWTGRSFRLTDGRDNPVYQLCEADLVALLPFLCRHAPDYRRGRPRDGLEVARFEPLLPSHQR